MTQNILVRPHEVDIQIGTGSTLKGFQRLVFEQYLEHGWIKPTDHPGQIAQDVFDPHSTAIVFTRESKVVGGTRLVNDSHLGFPHEETLNLNPSTACFNEYHELLRSTSRHDIVEITRVVGRIRHTTLFYNLAKALYWHHKLTGALIYPMLIDERLYKLGVYINMPMYPIGKPVDCEGSLTIPTITLPEKYPEVMCHPIYGWEYIQNPSNLSSDFYALTV